MFVKFRYRITEEKHTNTTVKSSHYGKNRRYRVLRNYSLKVGSYPLRHRGVPLITPWTTSLLFYRQIKDKVSTKHFEKFNQHRP